jgi:hypothetical protein
MGKHHNLIGLLLAVSIFILPINIQAGGAGPILALFDMEDRGSGLKPQVLSNLVDYLAAKLTEGGYKVVPRDQLLQRIKAQQKKSHKSCYDQSCQIELGRELAAQKSLSTKILRIGDTCQVTAVLYDLRQSTTDTAATAEAPCNVNKLLGAVKEISRKLCKPLSKSTTAKVTPQPKAEDTGLDEFEDMMKKVTQQKAKKKQIKKAWEIVSNIAGDDQILLDAKVMALNKFLDKFKKNNPYRKKAQELLASLSPATLTIKTNPEGAKVMINGKLAGTGPVTSSLKAGDYSFVASLSGHEDAQGQITLEPGKTEEVALTLNKIKPGQLVISTEPAGAQVTINGSVVGTSPVTKEVAAGDYNVVASLDGYESDDQTVSLTAGKSTEVRLQLEKIVPTSAYKLWGHVSLWSGVALAGFGGASLGMALGAANDYDGGDGDLEAKDKAEMFTGMMYLGFGLGASAIATGIILLVMDPGSSEDTSSTSAGVMPTADGQGMVFTLGGRW